MLTTEVAARLERKLGLGTFPLVRRRMYQRLQRLAVQHGDPVVEIIAQVEMEALGPKVRDKGQYFCWVVKRRLGELGYPLDAPQGPQPPVGHVPAANQVKQIVGRLADVTEHTRSAAVSDSPWLATEHAFVYCAVCGHRWPVMLGQFRLTVAPWHQQHGGGAETCAGSGCDVVERGRQ
jgi:hypothetical protein